MIIYCITPFNKLQFNFSFDLKFIHNKQIIYSETGIIEIIDNQPFIIKENNVNYIQKSSLIFDNTLYIKEKFTSSQLPTIYSIQHVQVFESYLEPLKSKLILHKSSNKPDEYHFETNLYPDEFCAAFEKLI